MHGSFTLFTVALKLKCSCVTLIKCKKHIYMYYFSDTCFFYSLLTNR
jgi:hypothetical protein